MAGTVINRSEFGGVTEYTLSGPEALQFYVELPVFVLLGLVSSIAVVTLMRSIFFAEDLGTQLQNKVGFPRWMRPAIAGLILGATAIFFPHIIRIGYETTSLALTGQLGLHEVIVFAVLKIFAVAVTMAGRMGGGDIFPFFNDLRSYGSCFWYDHNQRLS